MAENDDEEVTPEQTDLIVQFSVLTGTENLDSCANTLRVHEWDLNAAVATQTAPDITPQVEAEAPMATSSSTDLSQPNVATESSSAESLSDLFGDGVRRRNLAPSTVPSAPVIQLPPPSSTTTDVVEISFASRLISSLLSFSQLIFSSPLKLAQNAVSFVLNWWNNLGPELSSLQQVSLFGKHFNEQFDSKLPWLNCSYYSAVSSIRTGLRPIIVFIGNEQKSTDNAIFAQLLMDTHESMKDRVQFWGIDIKYGEGVRTAEMLFVSTYPTVLIIGLKNNSQHCLYRTSRPAVSIDLLKEKIEQAEAELVTARHELEMRDMDRRLREEQDLEFQRTMELDRKRIEDEERKKQIELEKLKQQEERENERQRRNTEQRERRISARLTLAPEPTEGGICIQFKLPDGSRHPRKFLTDAPIADVFMFVQSLDASPGDYCLATVFPVRKIMRDESATLSSLGIKNNEQLMVQAIQEFSSDEESDDSD